MSTRKLNKAVQDLFKQVLKLSRTVTKAFVHWLLRALLLLQRYAARQPQGGFVLPTVAMVSLVVVLLTLTMTVRSFDRSKNATNNRVDQAVLNVTAPALDRARAKLRFMFFEDEDLPKRGAPDDDKIREVLFSDEYTFPDEIRLKIAADLNENGTAGEGSFLNRANGQPITGYNITQDETTTAAWKFPVDTDGNGRFDSYVMYSLNWRLPPRGAGANSDKFARARGPVEARTRPMQVASLPGACSAGSTGVGSVSGRDWYSIDNSQVKSFFTYATVVPIVTGDPALTGTNANRYEPYRGTRGFVALENQLDYSRIALNNNAIVYEDDLAITPGPAMRINGRIFTNSNLFLHNASSNNPLDLYQISSKFSCQYQEVNSKVVVGGNVAPGGPEDTTNPNRNTRIDLFRGSVGNPPPDPATNVDFTRDERTTNQNPDDIAYNGQAYNERIASLVAAATARPEADDPSSVTTAVNERLATSPSLDRNEVRGEELEVYFRNRTRRVPFIEVGFGGQALTPINCADPNSRLAILQGTRDTLRPCTEWIFPVNPQTGTSFTNLTLRTTEPPATDPDTQRQQGVENLLGDRLQVGYNMPALWYQCADGTTTCTDGRFVGSAEDQNVQPQVFWDLPNNPQLPRTRQSRVTQLDELDTIARDALWEESAAIAPEDEFDNRGGLRLITGAGIYARRNSFLPPPQPRFPSATNPLTYDDPTTTQVEEYPVVWPDYMPMTPGLKVYDNVSNREVDLSSNVNDAADPADLTAAKYPPAPGTTIDRFSPKYSKGDLRMRATVVYHYKQDAFNPDEATNLQARYQEPMACISSFYDPTDANTARNQAGLPDVSGGMDRNGDAVVDETMNGLPLGDAVLGSTQARGRSNNGVVYNPPTQTAKDFAPGSVPAPNATTGLFPGGTELAGSMRDRLLYQANLVDPNGRFINAPLRNAMVALSQNEQLSLSQQAAIDSAICSLQILEGSLARNASVIRDGTIREVSLMDGRQIRTIHGPGFVAVDSARADGGGGGGATYNVYYNIPKRAVPDWTDLANVSPANNGDGYGSESTNDGQTLLNEIFKVGDLITVQGFDDPRLNAVRGEITAITTNTNANDATAGTLTVRTRGPSGGGIAETPSVAAGVIETLSTRYDLSVEEREPLEMRMTELDLNLMRTTRVGTDPFPASEYLIPNSGIVYVSRDDAMRDLSDNSTNETTRRILSATDYRLDPTRKLSGVMLVHGSRLDREINYRTEEKGFILATNLPVYLQGDTRTNISNVDQNSFNRHADPNGRGNVEEFTQTLAQPNWDNFYARQTLNPQFACRPNNPQNPNCTSGDSWRSAAILADAVSLVTNDYKLGYRRDGDFDLRNNQNTWQSYVGRRKNGFYTNSYAINGLTALDDPAVGGANDNYRDERYALSNANDRTRSSYHSFATYPVQRRSRNTGNRRFPEYIMEICRKLPVSECTTDDWVVGWDADGNGVLQGAELNTKSWELGALVQPLTGAAPVDFDGDGANDATAAGLAWNQTTILRRFGAGTTGRPAINPADRRYPRRVAFARQSYGSLVIDNGNTGQGTPRPLGVGCPLGITADKAGFSGCRYKDTTNTALNTPTNISGNWNDGADRGVNYGRADLTDNTLWFRTTNNRDGRPDRLQDVTYDGDRPLFIVGPEQGGEVIKLPNTPEIPGVRSLNRPAGDDRASNYSLCTEQNNNGASQKVFLADAIAEAELNRCSNQPGNPMNVINQVRADMLALNPEANGADSIVRPTGYTPGGQTFVAGSTTTFVNNPPATPVPGEPTVNVIDVNGNFETADYNPTAVPPAPNGCTRIVLQGDSNSIFILRRTSNQNWEFGSGNNNQRENDCGVQMELQGVNPNNVFWVANSNIQWNEVGAALPAAQQEATTHRMFGTFITDATGTPKWNTVKFLGARLLGPNGTPSGPNYGPRSSIAAIAGDGQPSLVPVLQMHVADEYPFENVGPSRNNEGDGQTNNLAWVQQSQGGTTVVNAILAMGDTPVRVDNASNRNRNEGNGGLHNFPRFKESQRGTYLINGGLIQIKRSIFATAPFSMVITTNDGNSEPYAASASIFGYYQAYRHNNGGIGSDWATAPFYSAPQRVWGFDPAILSQLPDLFAEQFAVPEPVPNQFYRQTNRDDAWLQALLCAYQPNQGNLGNDNIRTGQVGTLYQQPALPANHPVRPGNCPPATAY